jgi:hypothetical protein
MWLAQFVCAPQFFKTPKGLCEHTVFRFEFQRELLVAAEFPISSAICPMVWTNGVQHYQYHIRFRYSAVHDIRR